MATAETLCTACTAHFFAETDEAVQQYACQSLLAAVEEGSRLGDLVDSLQDFLPTSCSPQALREGLFELECALQQPQAQHGFAWLQAGQQHLGSGAAAGTGDGTAAATGAAVAMGAAAAQPLAQAAGAVWEQQPSAARGSVRSSGLSVGAAEFRPGGGAASSIAAGFGSLQLGGNSAVSAGGTVPDEWGDGATGQAAEEWWGGAEAEEEEEMEEEVGTLPSHSTRAPSGRGEWAAAAAAAEAQAAAGGGLAAGGAAAQAAFLAVLAEQFPLFSADALRQLFLEQRGDLAATVQTLCSLEAELEGQQQAGGWAHGGSSSVVDTPPVQAGPSFTDEDFPSLGGPISRSRPAGSSSSNSSAGQYASRAAAAAHLPAEPARRGAFARSPRRAEGDAPPALAAQQRGQQAGLGPAPIWQQEEGVARYATGQALAEEYTALRADARDHARLRNAFFQQATQAYLAGNRRQAKELGRQGRWHNEQMHAAHAGAAQQLFAQRNPGGERAPPGSTSNRATSSGSLGAVQTVDLHGLHVSEALGCVDDLLEAMMSQRQAGSRRLRLVVGEGKHARVPARLPACVKRHLDARGVAWTEPYAGLLEVRL